MRDLLFCCDWGTSSFRIRLVNTTNYTVLSEFKSNDGIARTFRKAIMHGNKNIDVYINVLKGGIEKISEDIDLRLDKIPIIVSGMASSSIGILDVPYAKLPFRLDGSEMSAKGVSGLKQMNNPAVLLSGVRSEDDVMRGEETQLIGLFNSGLLTNTGECLFILTGTHSKHIAVSQSSIIGFKTFMTGEIFQTLCSNTILKDSVSTGEAIGFGGDNENAFREGVLRSSDPGLLHNLFLVRTNQLFDKYNKEQNSFFLSGLLIGSELRHISQLNSAHIILCSEDKLLRSYGLALELLEKREAIHSITAENLHLATIMGQIQTFKKLNQSLL